MGDGARIESTDYLVAVGVGYVGRLGIPDGRDRVNYGVMIGANFHVFVDDHASFRLIVAGTLNREEPLNRSSVKIFSIGGAVEAHFGPMADSLYLGIGLNPRVAILSGFVPPEFELGIVGRLTATVGNFGMTLNVGGGLRLPDIERSSIEAGIGLFLNLF